jgi:hypothetical protein
VGTSVPVLLVESVFPVSGLTFQGNDYFSNGPARFQISWAGTAFTNLSSWGRDSRGASADPGLGFENFTGGNRFPSAYTVRDIDDMASELSAFFQLTSTTPVVIGTGGVNLAAMNPNWWLLDGFDWDEACGPAADLWGTALPDALGRFSMGACEYDGL